MKNHFAALLAVVALGATLELAPAGAQTTAPAGSKSTVAPRGGRAPRLPKRLVRGIEAKTGKPLTPDQTSRLLAAMQARKAAEDAAQDKFLSDAAGITGLSVQDLKDAQKGPRKAKEKPKAKA